MMSSLLMSSYISHSLFCSLAVTNLTSLRISLLKVISVHVTIFDIMLVFFESIMEWHLWLF